MSKRIDVEEVDPNGTYYINENFERISKFRYDQKDNILPKYCDFKFLQVKNNGVSLNKPQNLGDLKYNMSQRLDEGGSFVIELGKSIKLNLVIKFKTPHPRLDADLIRQETLLVARNGSDNDDAQERKTNDFGPNSIELN